MQHNEIHHDTNNPEHDHDKQDEHQADEEMLISERDQRMLGAESSNPSAPVEEEKTEEESPSESEGKELEETEEISKLREKLQDIRGPYLKLKWDAEHDQINPGQRTRYDKLKKEYEELESALKREIEKQK